MKIEESISEGINYLLSKIDDGLCLEFHQRRHGPSQAWTTACVGSSLCELGVFSREMIEAVVSLQHEEGGWSYNNSTPPDADSTLRVMQYLHKVGFHRREILNRAEEFAILHQGVDGGFSTYLPEAWSRHEYKDQKGWSSPHSCVTALASNVISDRRAVKKAREYIDRFVLHNGPAAYWWRTPLYVMYELGYMQKISIEEDPVDISLLLLLEAKRDLPDHLMVKKLLPLQNENGSFKPSRQFRVPRPYQLFSDLNGNEDIAKDLQGILSTSAAIVALSRQLVLLD